MPGHVGERSPVTTFGLLSLRRRWGLVASCGALFLAAGLLIVAFKPAQYTSATQLLVYVKQLQPGPDLVISAGRADLTQVQNEIEIIRSRGMLAKVVSALNLAEDDEVVPTSGLLRTVAGKIFPALSTPEDSRTKMERAVDFLEKHVTLKRVGTSHTILVDVATSDPNKSQRIAAAIGKVALQARVSAEQEGSHSPLLRERLQGLGPNAYIMTAPGAAGRPDGPRKILIVLAALLSGLAVGSVLALVLDLINRTVRTAAQIEYLGLECIGPIPRLRRLPSTDGSWPASTRNLADASELQLNGMRDQTLRRAMTAVAESKARTIGITSAVGREGVTTVAKYLAQIAALSGKKVLLVEAVKNETVSLVENKFGKAENAFGESSPLDGIILDECNGFDVLRTGRASGETNGAPAWRAYCDQGRLAPYDLIVVNLPSLGLGPEFRMAAKDLDGILLIIKWGSTELERLQRAIATSGAAPVEFIGAILNMVDGQMIGKFGDKFWEAEAAIIRRRNPFELSTPIESPVG